MGIEMSRHAVIALLLGLPPATHAQDGTPGEKGEVIRTCREMHLSAWSIWSKADIEGVIAAEILANLGQHGVVDRDCTARSFEAQGRNFELRIYRGVPASEAQGSPGRDAFRFKVDRTAKGGSARCCEEGSWASHERFAIGQGTRECSRGVPAAGHATFLFPENST